MTTPDEGLIESFAACRDDIFRLCLGYSRNVTEAEDLCQDVFVKALGRRDSLRSPEGLRVWLLRIARTTCLDGLRRAKRRPTVSLESHPGPIPDEAASDPPADPGPGLRVIKDAVRGLPRKQRDVFVLREYAGLSYREIAATLKTRPGTVMSRLNRARRSVIRAAREVLDEKR